MFYDEKGKKKNKIVNVVKREKFNLGEKWHKYKFSFLP